MNCPDCIKWDKHYPGNKPPGADAFRPAGFCKEFGFWTSNKPPGCDAFEAKPPDVNDNAITCWACDYARTADDQRPEGAYTRIAACARHPGEPITADSPICDDYTPDKGTEHTCDLYQADIARLPKQLPARHAEAGITAVGDNPDERAQARLIRIRELVRSQTRPLSELLPLIAETVPNWRPGEPLMDQDLQTMTEALRFILRLLAKTIEDHP